MKNPHIEHQYKKQKKGPLASRGAHSQFRGRSHGTASTDVHAMPLGAAQICVNAECTVSLHAMDLDSLRTSVSVFLQSLVLVHLSIEMDKLASKAAAHSDRILTG